MLDDFGIFSARAYTAGALPVEGATVRIRGGEEANRNVSYTLITDLDGVTESISLPAPKRSLTLSPDSKEIPYAIYDLEVWASGYYTKKIYGLMVFSGIKTVQEINMIPASEDSDTIIADYPRGNVNSAVPESDLTE